uniref:Uncharacterized protein n=1 Tax=Globodera rostochiensis TaxID=31243 RepID=A0A914IB35_GLORO
MPSPSTVCGGAPSEDADFFRSWQSVSAGKNDRRHFPVVVINHSSPKSIKKVLAANTVPRTTLDNRAPNQQQISCFCCAIETVETRRLRNCLYATAFVPASMLFVLFVVIWLSELRLI